jgi:hypothetical protein
VLRADPRVQPDQPVLGGIAVRSDLNGQQTESSGEMRHDYVDGLQLAVVELDTLTYNGVLKVNEYQHPLVSGRPSGAICQSGDDQDIQPTLASSPTAAALAPPPDRHGLLAPQPAVGTR